MVLQQPLPPAPPYYGQPAHGAVPPLPPPPFPPTPPQRPRPWRRLLIVGAATIAAAAVAGGAFAIGRGTAPTAAPVATPSTTAAAPAPQTPSVVQFTAADDRWCRQFQTTAEQIADEGKAAGQPRSFAASSQPASAWAPADADANRQFANYLSNIVAGLSDLRTNATNPTLALLIGQLVDNYSKMSAVIRDGSYVPANFSYLQTGDASQNGLAALCRGLVG
ncbi:hypothetical protein JF729_06975 [Mycobacterium intracellulare]|nr:hypothetical protein [Mycobacterium intracellulare]